MPVTKDSTFIIKNKLRSLKEDNKILDQWYEQYGNSSLSCENKIVIGMAAPYVLPISVVFSAICVIVTKKLLDIMDVTSTGEGNLATLGSGLMLTTWCIWSAGDIIQKGYNNLKDNIKKTEEELESLENQANTRKPQ